MGLDQYAYVAAKAGQRAEFYEGAQWDAAEGTFVNPHVREPQEIAYWRKHPNLQGWMERLWWNKTGVPRAEGDQFEQNTYPPDDFNGVELELTWQDIEHLEQDIKSGRMAALETTGFFFGKPSDQHYYQHDLEFCAAAKAELFIGGKVFYNSSW